MVESTCQKTCFRLNKIFQSRTRDNSVSLKCSSILKFSWIDILASAYLLKDHITKRPFSFFLLPFICAGILIFC